MSVVAHHVQFYDFTPSAFTCVSRCHNGLIATGKADGTIEVYDGERNFFMVFRIPRILSSSVESIGWAKSRLFVTGANGCFSEVDLNSSSLKVIFYILRVHPN